MTLLRAPIRKQHDFLTLKVTLTLSFEMSETRITR